MKAVRPTHCLLVILFFLVSLLQGCPSKQSPVNNLLSEHRYKEALDEANQALNDDPDNKYLVYNRGRAKMQLGQFEGAIEDFTKSLELNTDSNWSHWPFYRIGQVNRRRGQYGEAIENFSSALKFNSGWNRAVQARKKTKQGLKDIKKGEQKLKNEKYDDARPHFKEELDRHPDSMRANMGMGLVYLGQNKYEKAMSHFEKVLKYDSDHQRAKRYQKLASEFAESERSLREDNLKSEMESKAEGRFNDLVENGTEGVSKSLASVIEKLTRIKGREEAIRFLDQVKNEHPESALPELSQGLIYFQAGKLPEADTMLTQAIQKDSKGGIVYLKRGLTNHGRGQFEEAIHDFSRAFEDNSLPLDLRHKAMVNRGIAKVFLKQYDSAFEDFEQSVELQPDYPEQYFYLGYISDDREKFRQAETYFTRAIERDTNNVKYYDYRRKIRQQLGQTGGAIEDIERMQTLLDDKRPALAYQLARLYADQYRDASKGSSKQREALESSVSNLRFCLKKDYITKDVIEQDKKLENVVSTARYSEMLEDA